MTATGPMQSAILVRPNATIERATALPGEPGSIYARALEQHDVLRSMLQYFGVDTVVLDSHASDPYETAVGNAGIAFADGVVLMRPAEMSRRPEADRLQSELAMLDVPIAGHVTGPGLLDGDDVLLAGDTAFIGVGPHGNDLGRNGFAQIAQARGFKTVEVRLAAGVTTLRSVVGVVAKDTIVVGADKADRAAFAGFKTIVLDRGEESAAGVLCLSERHVIADMRYRTALAQMSRAGITVEAIDLYDFAKIGITPSMLALALKRD